MEPNVYCSVHKSESLATALSQMNPARNLISRHVNIILACFPYLE
jgi:hypothetical protein